MAGPRLFTVIHHPFIAPWGSVGYRGCPLCPSPHYPVSSPPPIPPFWKMEGVSKPPKRYLLGGGGPNEKRKSRETRRKGGSGGATNSFERSAGSRLVPRLSFVPVFPLSSRIDPCAALLTNGKRFETAETLGIGGGEGWRKWEEQNRKSA